MPRKFLEVHDPDMPEPGDYARLQREAGQRAVEHLAHQQATLAELNLLIAMGYKYLIPEDIYKHAREME